MDDKSPYVPVDRLVVLTEVNANIAMAIDNINKARGLYLKVHRYSGEAVELFSPLEGLLDMIYTVVKEVGELKEDIKKEGEVIKM